MINLQMDEQGTLHVFTSMSAAKALQDLGYRARIEETEEFCFIDSAAHGYDFRAYLFGPLDDGPHPIYRSCQFQRFFKLPGFADMERLNEACRKHNEKISFVKTYTCDRDQGPFLAIEMDCIVQFCDAYAVFKQLSELFINSLGFFIEDVLGNVSEPLKGAIEKFNLAVGILSEEAGKLPEAVELYKESAQAGYAGSQNNYGDLFESGRGVERSDLFAMYWYARSAERGEPTAYLSIASLLLSNSTGRQMTLEAAQLALLAFMSLPEGSNKAEAKYMLDNIGESLTQDEQEEVKVLAYNRRPLYQERVLLSDAPHKINPISEVTTIIN